MLQKCIESILRPTHIDANKSKTVLMAQIVRILREIKDIVMILDQVSNARSVGVTHFPNEGNKGLV